MTDPPVIAASLLEPGKPAQSFRLSVEPVSGAPLVSCIMPTRGGLFPARFAIECFLRQSYAARELIVVCIAAGSELEAHIAALGDSRIHFHRVEGATTVGAMRNRAIEHSAGELLCIWDDDDLSHPGRIALQLSALQAPDVAACFMARELLWWPAERRLAISQARMWENSMLARRDHLLPYPEVARGGDTILAKAMRATSRLLLIDHPATYCRIYHGGNLWGAEHFQMFFHRASLTFDDAGYEQALTELWPHLPLREYAAEIARRRGPESAQANPANSG